MHEAYWHPLYAKCEEWDIPIIVHGTNALDRRFRVVPHNYQLGFYTEQGLVKGSVNLDDVVDGSFVEAALKELGPYRP